MWKGGSQNSDSYWDNIQQNLYNMFQEADNILQIYRDEGLPVPEYRTHDNSHSYGGNYGSITYLGEYSGGHTSDEALARHLQELEDSFHNFSFDEPFRTAAGGVSQGGPSFSGDNDGVQDDFNPDEMTYEQISELGQSIGTVKKGLSEEQMSRLPTHKYKGSSKKKGKSADDDSECVICKMQYNKGDVLMTLPCAHKYHEECIKNWLKEDKSCCVCKVEVAV